MRMIGLRCTFAMFLLLLACPGWGAEVSGRSSTQALWFNNDFNDQRQVELAEYLRLSVFNIDDAGKFSIHGYGRGTVDLMNGNSLNGRLYYLYGSVNDLYDKIDMRLGRQFVNLSAGSAIIDGGQFDLKNIGPVGLTVLGGRDVIFGVDGELSHGGDYALGVAAHLAGFRKTDLEVSWFRKWDEDDISRDMLGATFKQYVFNTVRLYGNARFDLVTEVFNEVLGGVKYYPTANLVLTGEWYQSYPTFDTTSIYSVFAVDRYQEGVFRLDYTFNELFSVNGGYTYEDFGEDAHAHVYQVGCAVRPIESLLVNVEYDNRQGYFGSMNGIIAEASYDVGKELQLAGGITFDVYERDSLSSDEIARKYWGGAKYRMAKNLAASLRIEDDVNARYHENLQGRFILDYDF